MKIKKPNEDADKKELNESGIYLFMEDFTESSCKNAIDFILTQNIQERPLKYLQLMISSHGGDFNACLALIDVMKGSKIPIHTVGLGIIASCGILTFMSGEKGYRYITPNTTILSHQYSSFSYGKEHELFAAVKSFEITTEQMIEHYKKCTGLPLKTIKEILLPPEDVFLTAEEAIKYKIADQIKKVY